MAAALAECVKLVAMRAISGRMPSPPQTPHSSRTLPSRSQSPSGMFATALVDLARSVAHAAGIEFTNARVDVVTDAVAVGVGLTRSAALAECVKLVAIAVAIAGKDAVATATPHSSRTLPSQSQSPSGMSAQPHS